MFEGLDQVNWRKLRSNGSGADIPILLRAFAEAPEEESGSKAFGKLLDQINHQDDIYSATAATVPFLIQLLSKEDFPRRNWIPSTLIYLLESCDLHLTFQADIRSLTDDFATLANIGHGVPVYLPLLRDPNEKIRAEAAYLLLRTNSQRPSVRLRLWRAAEREKNPFVRALMIYGLGNLIGLDFTNWRVRSLDRYRKLVGALINPDEKPIVHLAAALALVESGYSFRDLPTIIAQTLGNALALHPSREFTREFRLFAKLFDDKAIVKRLKTIPLNQGMGEALQAANMTAEATHLIIREMFELSFTRIGPGPLYARADDIFDKWWDYSNHRSPDIGVRFDYSYSVHRGHRSESRYYVGKPLTKLQQLVIEKTVNCDVFWQIPTNLFSFFYGLPDSRDELRALLTS